jgi:hypothetical protein
MQEGNVTPCYFLSSHVTGRKVPYRPHPETVTRKPPLRRNAHNTRVLALLCGRTPPKNQLSGGAGEGWARIVAGALLFALAVAVLAGVNRELSRPQKIDRISTLQTNPELSHPTVTDSPDLLRRADRELSHWERTVPLITYPGELRPTESMRTKLVATDDRVPDRAPGTVLARGASDRTVPPAGVTAQYGAMRRNSIAISDTVCGAKGRVWRTKMRGWRYWRCRR